MRPSACRAAGPDCGVGHGDRAVLTYRLTAQFKLLGAQGGTHAAC
jgi:hypothetical protein